MPFRLRNHGSLKHKCTIHRETHVRAMGINVIIHALHELGLKARGPQLHLSQQLLQICNIALLIPTIRTTCLPEQTVRLTFHYKGNRYVVTGHQKRGQNWTWLHHPYLLGHPRLDRPAT